MSASDRIQWLHQKIIEYSYPNSVRIAEKFNISHRQAQRDVDYLKRKLGAPLEYSAEHKGYYYTAEYSLPVVISYGNDETYAGEIADIFEQAERNAEASIIQMQMPYTATLEIPDKLAVLNMSKYIISRVKRNRYICQFRSVELFLGILIMLNSNIKIVEPYWLRDRLIRAAKNALDNNSESPDN